MEPDLRHLHEKRHFFIFRIFNLLGWFFKYDFWNPRKILDRHRCSKKILDFFSRWKTFLKKCFWGKFWFFFEKCFKISKFYKDLSQKSIFQILTFVINPYRILRFPNIFKKFQNFPQNFFEKKFSSRRKKIKKFFRTPMSMQNFIRIPKIILIKSCEQAKDAKNKK